MKASFIKNICIICITVGFGMANAALAAAASVTQPFPFPSPPNNPYGTYEPSMTADQQTIYFAMFPAPIGNPDPNRPGNRDIYVSYKKGDKWTEPELLPAPVNSEHMDTEPMISADGRTLIFMSNRPGGMGNSDLYMVKMKASSNEWGTPVNMGAPFNTKYKDHCLVMATNPNGEEVAYWATKRPLEKGKGFGSGDILMSKKLANGKWSEAVNPGKAINTGQNQCRFVPGIGNKMGIVTDHDKSHHQEFMVRWDDKTEQWVGPRIMAGWNHPGGQSEGCGRFTPDGKKWVWSSGRDLPAGYSFPDRFALYWLDTDTMTDYYQQITDIDVR